MSEIFEAYADLIADAMQHVRGALDESASRVVPAIDRALLLPKQRLFLENEDRHALYSGAFGAGKSRALCFKLVERARHPRAREGLVRKNLSALRTSTLETLLEPEGELPPVLPQGSYKHNHQKQEIRIIGGGTIFYFGIDDPEQRGSMNLTGCGIDEMHQLTLKDYLYIDGRCRVKHRSLRNQIYSGTNPGPPTHWAAARWGIARGKIALPSHWHVRTSSRDNTFLSEEVLASWETMEGVSHKRYVLGEWAGSDAMVFLEWDREIHLLHRPDVAGTVVFGVDDGFEHAFAVIRGVIDGDGHFHGTHCWKERRLLISDKIKILAEAGARDAQAVVVDPNARILIAEMENQGFPVIAGENERSGGLARFHQRLGNSETGPRATFEPSMEEFIEEIETYENRPDKKGDGFLEDPVKRNDHLMDATRYLLWYVDESSGEYVIEVV